MVRICQNFSCRLNVWEFHDDVSSLGLVQFLPIRKQSEIVGSSPIVCFKIALTCFMSCWSLCAKFCDAISGTFWIRMLVLQACECCLRTFSGVLTSLSFTFFSTNWSAFLLSFQGTTNVLYFYALQCGLDSCFRETIVTIVSEVWELLQRFVLICCHRHTLCVGPWVASIALKPAATVLFSAFDTVVLRYGATTAALAAAIRYEIHYLISLSQQLGWAEQNHNHHIKASLMQYYRW